MKGTGTRISRYISLVDIVVTPTATACFFPSAIIATTVFAGTSHNLAPGEVRPGHIILDPFKTCLIAPRSICNCGSRKGSAKKKPIFSNKKTLRVYYAGKKRQRWRLHLCRSFSEGTKGPSRWRKKITSPDGSAKSSICSWLKLQTESKNIPFKQLQRFLSWQNPVKIILCNFKVFCNSTPYSLGYGIFRCIYRRYVLLFIKP